MHNSAIVFSIIGAVVSIGGIFIAVGVFKSKIHQNAETNKEQNERMKNLASKNELTAAVTHVNERIEFSIKRSDEILAIMKERAEEDRAKGQGQYHEFYNLLNGHEKRISSLETHFGGWAKTLDELKAEVKDGFKEIQNELKELRKQA